MKDEKEEIKPAPLKSWKDWCREAGTECGCGDVCMYAPKPAPLGEGKKDYTDADVAFANSYQRDNKHYIQRGSLGESSEEQKRVPKLVKWAKDGYPPIDLNGQYRHVVELIWHYIDMEKRSTSPTSEPPEEQIQAEQNALILGTLLDLNDQCYHYMKANPPDKTKMTYNSWESILEQLQYYKSEYGTGKAPEEQEELWNFMKRNSNGHTEFRVVVMDDGKAYAHVLGRDSETFDFKI